MGNQTYSGKSIAEQLLGNTWVGQLLYGKPETYKDGYGAERKDADFKESANGQLVQRMGETGRDVGQLTADVMFDTASDIYYAGKSLIEGDWKNAGLNLAFIALPMVGGKTVRGINRLYRNLDIDPLYTHEANISREMAFEKLDNLGLDVEKLYNTRRVKPTTSLDDPSPDEIIHYLHQAKLAEEGVRNHKDISEFLDYRRRFMEKYPYFIDNLSQGGTLNQIKLPLYLKQFNYGKR